MSKIYEALQRAEQERLARNGAATAEPPAPAPAIPAQYNEPEAPYQSQTEPAFAPIADTPPEAFVQIPDLESSGSHAVAAAQPRGVSSRIFADIVPAPWTPAVR